METTRPMSHEEEFERDQIVKQIPIVDSEIVPTKKVENKINKLDTARIPVIEKIPPTEQQNPLNNDIDEFGADLVPDNWKKKLGDDEATAT